VKIQKGLTHHLDEAEERTVENLKKSYFAGEEDEDDEDDDEVPHAVDLGMAAQLKRQRTDNQRRNVDQNRGDYINCDNIFGSSAEVERLWSVASYILTTQRQSMTPQLFEAIIFLKTNHEFWDLGMVVDAVQQARTVAAETRVAKDLEQLELARVLGLLY
jgi:hypothetical protein